MNQGREQVPGEDAALERREVADRLADQAVLLTAQERRRLSRDIREPPEVMVAGLVRLGGMEHGDLDRLEIGQPAKEGSGVADGGIVALHVGDQAYGTRPRVGSQYLVGFAQCVAHRLLGENVLPRPKRVDDHLAVGVGAKDGDGLDLVCEQVTVVRRAPADVVVIGDVLQGRRRYVTERNHLVGVGELPEMGQVHHLGDQPAADDTDLDARHSRFVIGGLEGPPTPPALGSAPSRAIVA